MDLCIAEFGCGAAKLDYMRGDTRTLVPTSAAARMGLGADPRGLANQRSQE